MTDSSQQKLKKVRFDDKEYEYESLSDEAKNDITGLQVCEAQLKMYSDTIKLINISRQSISEKLKEKLKDVNPL